MNADLYRQPLSLKDTPAQSGEKTSADYGWCSHLAIFIRRCKNKHVYFKYVHIVNTCSVVEYGVTCEYKWKIHPVVCVIGYHVLRAKHVYCWLLDSSYKDWVCLLWTVCWNSRRFNSFTLPLSMVEWLLRHMTTTCQLVSHDRRCHVTE